MYLESHLCLGRRLLLSPCQTERTGCHHPLNQVRLEDWVHPKIENTTGLLFQVTDEDNLEHDGVTNWLADRKRQAGRKTGRQRDRQTDRQTDRKKTQHQADEWTDRQTDSRMDGQTDTKKDRKTNGRRRRDWTTDGPTHKYTLGKWKRNRAYVFVVNVDKYSSFISFKGSGRSYQ